MEWRRLVTGVGRTLITVGVLLLLFVAHQLWGTGLSEARAQDRLRADFLGSLSEQAVPPESSARPPVASSATPPPIPGEAVAIIRIPKIDLEKAVVEGVGVEDLKKAPGHYPTTPLPGQPGNAAIAGHRTTYGAPFFRLDELEPGDDITVRTRDGDFAYRVTGSRIVRPDQSEVLANTQDHRLTLTTCHPRYSARQRLIVIAALVGPPAKTDAPVGAQETRTVDRPQTPTDEGGSSLSGDRSAAAPTFGTGALAAFVWATTWLASRRWRSVAAYAIGGPVFLIVLFVFYENVARLLPANI